jgi:hypothetical protein
LLLVFTSCDGVFGGNPEQSTTSNLDTLPEYQPGDIKLSPPERWNGFTPKYRYVYYNLKGDLIDLVPYNEYKKWDDSYLKKINFFENNLEEMITVTFVKLFNITKEDFERIIKENQSFQMEHDMPITEEEWELPK